jgi:cytosine/adenosine deaminase-related metal-dependent hydrolase
MEILTASWVLPVVGPPLRDGRVAVEGGRVVWVGRAGDPGQPEGDPRPLGRGVLLPGLVNAHCHLELSHLHGRVTGEEGFVPWIESVVATRAADDVADVREATAAAVRLLEQRGTAAVGDVSNAVAHLDLLAASRLRAVVFLELLAWDPARAAEVLAFGRSRRDAVAAGLPRCVEVRLAAHAPHSVSPELLRLLAREGGLAAIHLAESEEERRFLADGLGPWREFLARRGLGHVVFEASGHSPVAHVEALGGLHPGLVAAHGVQTDEADRRTLARRGVHVVLCPRSNRNLGVGRADLPALLDAGVRLALGTDSLASVETLDVLEDAVLLSRQFPAVPRETILGLATRGGALALGLGDLGALAPGMTAALAFAPAEAVREDPYGFLLSGEAALETVALS